MSLWPKLFEKKRNGSLEMNTPHTHGFVSANLKECHLYVIGESNAYQQQMMMEILAAKALNEYPERFMESILPGFGLLQNYVFKARRTNRSNPETPILSNNSNAVTFTVHIPLPTGVFEVVVWLIAEIPSARDTIVIGISNDVDVEETLRNTIRVV